VVQPAATAAAPMAAAAWHVLVTSAVASCPRCGAAGRRRA
jgi:hypothetical protein